MSRRDPRPTKRERKDARAGEDLEYYISHDLRRRRLVHLDFETNAVTTGRIKEQLGALFHQHASRLISATMPAELLGGVDYSVLELSSYARDDADFTKHIYVQFDEPSQEAEMEKVAAILGRKNRLFKGGCIRTPNPCELGLPKAQATAAQQRGAEDA